MKVRELIEKLSQFDSDTEVACYSVSGECDFGIDEVRIANTDEYGIEDCYCQADTNFADCGNVVVISGGYR